MKERPTSVSVISWILIVMSGISLVASLFMMNNPMAQEMMAKTPIPIPVQYAMLYVGLSVSITCGIFMLRGANWARLLYVGWSTIGFVISFATSPARATLVPGVVVLGVIVFFLFRPAASAFFKRSSNIPLP